MFPFLCREIKAGNLIDIEQAVPYKNCVDEKGRTLLDLCHEYYTLKDADIEVLSPDDPITIERDLYITQYKEFIKLHWPVLTKDNIYTWLSHLDRFLPAITRIRVAGKHYKDIDIKRRHRRNIVRYVLNK